MGKSYQVRENVFVLPVDMENRSAEDIARDPVDIFVHKLEYTKEVFEEEVNEGINSDYWESTAGNAIKPLYQLMVFAELRPDGVWDGD